MKNKNLDIDDGLRILAKIIARKFISDCQIDRQTKFDVGERPDMPEKLAVNKEGKAISI